MGSEPRERKQSGVAIRLLATTLFEGATPMVIFRLGSAALIRITAVMSVLLGALYLPSVFHVPSILAGLSHEITEEQQAVKLWAMYSVCGGLCIFAGTFLLRVSRTSLFDRLIWTLALLSILLLVAAQLPPLFWWLYVGSAFFTLASAIGLGLHLLLIVLAFWGAFETISSYDRRRSPTT